MTTATAQLLVSLDAIVAETTRMLSVLDDAPSVVSPPDRRDAKRRTIELRDRAQEFFDWLREVPLEEQRH